MFNRYEAFTRIQIELEMLKQFFAGLIDHVIANLKSTARNDTFLEAENIIDLFTASMSNDKEQEH